MSLLAFSSASGPLKGGSSNLSVPDDGLEEYRFDLDGSKPRLLLLVELMLVLDSP